MKRSDIGEANGLSYDRDRLDELIARYDFRRDGVYCVERFTSEEIYAIEALVKRALMRLVSEDEARLKELGIEE